MKFLILLSFLISPVLASEYRVLFDQERERSIPVQINFPLDATGCNNVTPCPVAFLSSGYGVAYDKYAFITAVLNKAGYLVVAIQHELPADPPLAVTGNLFAARSENWMRGAATIRLVRHQLKSEFSGFNFDKLTLVGHSNGGDISSWLINENADFVQTLITLDHRRVPLPRVVVVSVLSIRGSDFPADAGVLYTEQETIALGACIVQVENSKHNDMTDFGPDWLKTPISNILSAFLSGQCTGAEKAE